MLTEQNSLQNLIKKNRRQNQSTESLDSSQGQITVHEKQRSFAHMTAIKLTNQIGRQRERKDEKDSNGILIKPKRLIMGI